MKAIPYSQAHPYSKRGLKRPQTVMSTHTPGPWTISTHERHTTIEAPYFTIAVDVANCDAALIAAAPDLLAALKPFAEGRNAIARLSLQEAVDLTERVRAAIQKAEGTQS